MTSATVPTSSSSVADAAIAPLPAGGDQADRFDWQEAWYPVFYVKDLEKTKLATFTLLERDLVIWWDEQASCWRAFDDQCPHRLAPLSQGRIAEDGLLECPYHGWAFSGSGDCQRIPQQPEGGTAETSRRACVASLPTTVEQGMLFVYAGDPTRADRVPVPIVEPLEESPEKWVCMDMFRDLPYDALTLLENVLDSSHVPFTHHRSVSKREYASPVELEVLDSDRQGFRGFWQDGPRKGTLGSQNTRFIAPSLMWHDLTAKQLGRTMTVVYATPIRKGECRVFARFPFQFASKLPEFFIKIAPQWYSHLGQNGVLEDDQIFLHHQERYLEARGGGAEFSRAFYLPTKADRFVFELRQWVETYQADPFPGQTLPPALPDEVLLDRYHSHTKHCKSCRVALSRIQAIRTTCAIAAIALWASFPVLWAAGINLPLWGAIALSGTVLGLGTAWWRLGRLVRQFYEGRTVPPRNHAK